MEPVVLPCGWLGGFNEMTKHNIGHRVHAWELGVVLSLLILWLRTALFSPEHISGNTKSRLLGMRNSRISVTTAGIYKQACGIGAPRAFPNLSTMLLVSLWGKDNCTHFTDEETPWPFPTVVCQSQISTQWLFLWSNLGLPGRMGHIMSVALPSPCSLWSCTDPSGAPLLTPG